MKIFDAHIRSDTQADTALKHLHYFETERVITTAHAARNFNIADDLLDYFESLVTTECYRIRRCGPVPHVALGVLPAAQPRRAYYEVWKELPFMLQVPEVVAVGEIGVWEDTASQWELFERQVNLAKDHDNLPLIITPPKKYRVTMTYKMMQRIEKLGFPPERALMNYLDARTLENVLKSGFASGLAVGASTVEPREAARIIFDVLEKLASPERIILNSGLRAGGADILGIPKVIVALQGLGVDVNVIERLVYGNAMKLFI